jgi:ATPase subunit of ABC transporter with duplicated ATPase domains
MFSEKSCRALKDFEGTMIFVSHDRMFLCGLSSRCWNWAVRAARIAIPLSILGSYVEYVQKLGHEAPGIYS